jgi:hypothetical protein
MKPRFKFAAIALAVGLHTGSALAVQVFEFTLSGTAFGSARFPGPMPITGTARVTLADGGDGVYTGREFQFSGEARVPPPLIPASGSIFHFGLDGSWPGGIGPHTVTVEDGHVTAIRFAPYDVGWSVMGMTVNFYVPYGGYHSADWGGGTATLHEVSAVPEPETWALMFGGLLALLRVAKRRQP